MLRVAPSTTARYITYRTIQNHFLQQFSDNGITRKYQYILNGSFISLCTIETQINNKYSESKEQQHLLITQIGLHIATIIDHINNLYNMYAL